MERTGLTRDNRNRRGEVRCDIEGDEMSVGLDERPDHFVPEAQIEREIRARPPVVLHEEARFTAAQWDRAGTVLHRGLLREPQQKVSEVVSADARGGARPTCRGP